ncbi:unnamed protein product [Trifolium pratense]|uniref:Uncharacterized protein n=1 Tax=Trifolium pratense TaxID=57577 RepID=A0ACB0IWC0_TRIPR|nr:unnamed protein product [Trifolium pratense]
MTEFDDKNVNFENVLKVGGGGEGKRVRGEVLKRINKRVVVVVMHMIFQQLVVMALHIQVWVVVRPVVVAKNKPVEEAKNISVVVGVNCNELVEEAKNIPVVVGVNCNELVVHNKLVVEVVMGMVVGDKVFDMVVEVSVLHKVVVMEVVVVLYKVGEMVVVGNGLVVEVSELEEVVGEINRDKQVEEGSEVAVEANEVVVVEVNEKVVEVSYSSMVQVVVGRIQEPVEVVAVVNLVAEVAET